MGATPIRPLAWERPYVVGAALKRKVKRQKGREEGIIKIRVVINRDKKEKKRKEKSMKLKADSLRE